MVGTPGIPVVSPSEANKNRNLQAGRASEVASKAKAVQRANGLKKLEGASTR